MASNTISAMFSQTLGPLSFMGASQQKDEPQSNQKGQHSLSPMSQVTLTRIKIRQFRKSVNRSAKR
eukprot:1793016-Amphidinium_carterae.1